MVRFSRPLRGLIGGVATTTACVAGDASFSVTERFGDTVRIENARPIREDTVVPMLIRLYGSRDASLEREFFRILSFAVGPTGDVVAYDVDSGIKRFAASGDFLEWVARQGEGPDEVQCPRHLAVSSRGLVVAYDLCGNAIRAFQAGGTVTWPRPAGMMRYGSNSLFFDDADQLWVGVNPSFGQSDAVGFPRPIYVRVTHEGEFVDTVTAPARLGELCPLESEGMYRAGFWEDKRVQWFPKGTWALGTDGRLLLGCPRDYTFDVVGANGSVTRVVNAAWVPVRTSTEEKQFHERWWQPLPPLPDERPAYVALLPDGTGRTWVWPVQAAETAPLPPDAQAMMGRTTRWLSGRSGAFDVYDREGRWLARVALPEGVEYSGHPDTTPIVIRGDTIWAVTRDEYDIPYIGRYEVHLAPAAGG